jgi:CHAD domain-containing protein
MEKIAKYDLPKDIDEESFLRGLAEIYNIKREPAENQANVYYDTFDWRLYNKSLTFVQRRKEFFLISSTDDAVLSSIRVSGMPVFVWDFPDGAFRKFLNPLLEMRALVKQLHSRRRIKRLRILNEDEKTIARLLLSSEEIIAQDDSKLSLNRVFLESVRGYEESFRELAEYLAGKGFPVSRQHIFEATRKILARKPGEYSTKIKIPMKPETPADQAAKVILRFLLSVIRENEAGIRRDIDTEFLHDFRVAIRRTRSALGQIKNVFPPEITKRFRKEFARVGRTSNWLRDLDVYLLSEAHYKAMLPEKLRDDIHPLFRHLQRERKKELRKVIRLINSEEYVQILKEWKMFLNANANDHPAAVGGSRPILNLAQARIYKRYRKIVKSGRKISDDSPDNMLHSLRIECKRLRYLLEFFASLFPKDEVERLIKQLKKLQDNLGLFQDLSVQEETLAGFVENFSGENPENRKTILAIGALVGALDAEKRSVRKAFSKTFANFASAENNQLFTALFATVKRSYPAEAGEII